MKFESGKAYWCWWMSRNLYFCGRTARGYKFVDIADCVFVLSEDDARKLTK